MSRKKKTEWMIDRISEICVDADIHFCSRYPEISTFAQIFELHESEVQDWVNVRINQIHKLWTYYDARKVDDGSS
jgi:hypothetical protein